MKTRFIAGLILVFMVLGVFAGCEKKEPILLTADNIDEVAKQMTDEYLYTYTFDFSQLASTGSYNEFVSMTGEVLLNKNYPEEDFINSRIAVKYSRETWMSGSKNNTNQDIFNYALSIMTVNGRPATRLYNILQYKIIENDDGSKSSYDIGALIVVNDKDEASIYPHSWSRVDDVRDVITRLTTEEDLGEDSLTKSTLDKLDIKKATLKLQQRTYFYKGIWLDTQYDFPEYLDLIINDTFYKNGKIVHDSEVLLDYITEEKTDSGLLYYNIFNDENGLIKYDESYLELLEKRYEYYSSQESN